MWTSTRSRISEATRITLQENLEEDNRKDTPAFGGEDLEEIHRSGTEAGLLGIYNFPGAVYATDGSESNDRGVMGAGFFMLNEHPNSRTNTLSNEIKYAIKSPSYAATSRLGLFSSSIK